MDHGPDHSRKVLGYINAVLEKTLKADESLLKAIDIYLLCSSAYLHDIGMQVEFRDGSFQAYSPKFTLTEQKEIRTNHAKLSEIIIAKLIRRVDFAQQGSLIGSKAYSPALQLLCGAHRGADSNAIGLRLHKLPTDVISAIRMHSLVGFLQFGDAAHMSKDRVVGKDVEKFYLSGSQDKALYRFLEQQYFNCLYIDDAMVFVDDNATIHFKLKCSRSADDDGDIVQNKMDVYWGKIQRSHRDSISLLKSLGKDWSFASDISWSSPNTKKRPCPSYLHIFNESIEVHDTATPDIAKLAIIGLGQSTVPQLAAKKELPNFEFRYFSDKDIKSQEKELGYKKEQFFTNYKKMLLVKDIDAVVIATELKNHYYQAKDVLNAGKNLLLEKPATSNLNQLRELIQLAGKKKLCFVCSLHAAFDETINWILDKKNIAFLENKYGWTNELLQIKCDFFDPYLFERTPHKHRFYSLHDSWLDSGINALSVVNRFVNSENILYRKSTFQMCADPNYMNTIIDAEVDYSFNETGNIYIHTSWNKNINKKTTTLTNSKNMEMKLDHTEQKIILIIDNSKQFLIKEFDNNRLVNQYINLYRDFYMHLTNGTNNLIVALKLHELLFKAIENQQPSS